MKKLVLCLFVICLMVSLTAIENVTIHGKMMFGIWGSTSDSNSPVIENFYDNSRVNINWTNGNKADSTFEATLELGVNPNNLSLRRFGFSLPNQNGYSFKIAHDWVNGLDQCSVGATDPSFKSDGPISGIAVLARTGQISIKKDNLSISFLQGIKANPSNTNPVKSIPRIAISESFKIMNVDCTPAMAYGYYWDKENHYNACVISLIANTKINEFSLISQVFMANNLGDLGGFSIQSNATSTNKNIQTSGAWGQVGYRDFYFGTGYTRNKTMDTEIGNAFFQWNKKIWETFSSTLILTPETGLFFGNNVPENMFYVGAKLTAKF